MMKRCPVCGEVSFEDMEVCYGCLYRFGEGAGLAVVPEPEREADAPCELRLALPEVGWEVPDLESGLREDASSESWTLRVELRDPQLPARTWMVELAPQSKNAPQVVAAREVR